MLIYDIFIWHIYRCKYKIFRKYLNDVQKIDPQESKNMFEMFAITYGQNVTLMH